MLVDVSSRDAEKAYHLIFYAVVGGLVSPVMWEKIIHMSEIGHICLRHHLLKVIGTNIFLM